MEGKSTFEMTAVGAALALSILLGGAWLETTFANPSSHSRQLYNRVMQEFRDKDYDAALAGFQLFLELYGESNLASNAQFWMGECEFRLKRYQQALVSYEKVLNQHPTTSKLAGATVKMGLIYGYLGQRDQSRIMLERVLVDFPESREAKAARKAIERWELWKDEAGEATLDSDTLHVPLAVDHQPDSMER